MTNKKKTSFLERLTGISDVEDSNSKNIKSDYSNNGDDGAYSGSNYSNQRVEIEQDNSDNNSSISNQNESELKEEKSNRKEKNNNMVSDEEGQLTLDVYQTPEEIIIKSTIAGVNPDDLDVSIANDMVTIKGERKNNEEVRSEDYYYQECYWGKFSRSVILPVDINPDKSKAILKNGILTIKLPKIERTKTKKIKIVEE
ncbi:MAG TPA: Hsp20/alpha crystallin family protein [Candidatus Portnoybacteria bacterium]|nr:Hsp20/alpha crystallin family protein [Candidatus Portnoybacteria bacterium]